MGYGSNPVDVRRDLVILMRDGTRQFADVYLPRDETGPWPVILERTPYSKDNSSEVLVDAPNFYASHGYAVVISDVRGRFKSQGDFYPFRDHASDGYDTVEWIAAQPWCNGKVGTMGGSYSGVTQYQLAPTRPPHLTCMFCRESSSDYQQEWVFRGGAFELGFMWTWTVKWLLNSGRARGDLNRDRIGEIQAALEKVDEWHNRIPLAPVPLVEGHYDWLNEWLERCDDASLWNQFNIALRHTQVDTPIFHLGGWFDIFQRGTFDHYLGLCLKARSPEARRWQRLIVGPWIHGPKPIGERVQGEIDFGFDAALDFNALRLPWYDYWLKGLSPSPGAPRRPGQKLDVPVELFVMGVNEWREFETWPPPGAVYTNFYFTGRKNGSADSLNDGTLSTQLPGAREAPDTYDYDPLKPTPSIGGNTLNLPGGPRDQRPAEKQSLTFTTDPLPADLTVIGPVRCVLYASSSCKDTDWVVKLCDVAPPSPSATSPSLCLCDGLLRARYRASRLQPHLLEPGRIYRFEVDLWCTAHVFKKGHRIRVSVCSSSFPRFDRNLNTGAKLYFDGAIVVARNTVYHDAEHASHVVLPVA